LRKNWSLKLDDALWVYRTVYKTPIGMTPYKMIYGKSCHIPVKIEHKAYWAIKAIDFDMQAAGENQILDLKQALLGRQPKFLLKFCIFNLVFIIFFYAFDLEF
jgi:hypothetical protein